MAKKGFPRAMAAASSSTSTTKAGPVKKMPVQAASTAADVAALVTDFNALLTKLKNAGMMNSA